MKLTILFCTADRCTVRQAFGLEDGTSSVYDQAKNAGWVLVRKGWRCPAHAAARPERAWRVRV